LGARGTKLDRFGGAAWTGPTGNADGRYPGGAGALVKSMTCIPPLRGSLVADGLVPKVELTAGALGKTELVSFQPAIWTPEATALDPVPA
jgi:hypothetical protein